MVKGTFSPLAPPFQGCRAPRAGHFYVPTILALNIICQKEILFAQVWLSRPMCLASGGWMPGDQGFNLSYKRPNLKHKTTKPKRFPYKLENISLPLAHIYTHGLYLCSDSLVLKHTVEGPTCIPNEVPSTDVLWVEFPVHRTPPPPTPASCHS